MKQEAGFSLIEILVALLLVSMAFLGFLAVQMKATVATKDAAIRTQAVSAMAVQAEILRENKQAQAAQSELLQRLNRLEQGSGIQMMESYVRAMSAVDIDCQSNACDANDMAKYRTLQNAKAAAQVGIRLNMISNTIIGAWGDTPATQADDGCISHAGKINLGASCMTMEY